MLATKKRGGGTVGDRKKKKGNRVFSSTLQRGKETITLPPAPKRDVAGDAGGGCANPLMKKKRKKGE